MFVTYWILLPTDEFYTTDTFLYFLQCYTYFYASLKMFVLFQYLIMYFVGLEQLSQYSDSLRAGRSGDRIPVWASFSATVQTGPGAHPGPCAMGTGHFRGGKAAGAWH